MRQIQAMLLPSEKKVLHGVERKRFSQAPRG